MGHEPLTDSRPFRITVKGGITVSLYNHDGDPWLKIEDEDDGEHMAVRLGREALAILAEHAARLAR